MKKINILLLIIILTMGCKTVSCRAGEITNLIKNSGFEITDTDGKPTDWYFYGGAFGTQFKYSGNAYSGNKAIIMESTSALYMSSSIRNIVPCTTYTVSVAARLMAGSSFTVQIEFTHTDNETGEIIYGNSAKQVFSTPKDIWKKVDFTVEVPEDTANVIIMLRTFGAAKCAFDDISFVGETTEESKAYIPKTPIGNEMLSNIDFETKTVFGGAQGWIAYRPEGFPKNQDGWVDNSFVSYSDGNGIDNSGCVKLVSGGTVFPFVYQQVQNIIPGAEYEIIVNVKGESSDKVAVKIEFYTGPNFTGGLGNISSAPFAPEAEWKTSGQVFRAPDNCRYMMVYLRLYGGGTVYYDNVYLYQTDTPQVFDLSTNKIFAQTGEDSITATVNLYTYGSQYENGFVKLALKDGESYLTDIVSKQFDDMKAEWTFNVASFQKGKEYTVEATVTDSEGIAVETKRTSVFRYDRPLSLDEKGNYHKVTITDSGYEISEEIFNPIFVYHATVDDFERCKAAGINLVQSYSNSSSPKLPTAEYLDAAEGKGMMVLIPLYAHNMKPAGHPDNIENTKRVLNQAKDHNATFGYIIMDEPYNNDPYPEENLKNSYKIIRDIDPVHPVFVMENAASNYKKVALYADILGIDPYPQGVKEPTTFVSDCVRTANEAVDNKKPIYCLLQTFSYRGYMPDAADTKSMIYQTFMNGAKAVGYYCFENSDNGLDLDETEIWQTLVDFYTDESSFWFDTANGKYQISKYENDNVYAAEYISENRSFLVLANKKGDTAVNENIPFDADKKIFPPIDDVITLGVGEVKLFEVLDLKDKIGFYKTDRILNKIESGQIQIGYYSNDDKMLMTVLYKCTGNIKELIGVSISEKGTGFVNTVINVPQGTLYKIKAFAVYSLNNLDFRNGAELN